MSQKKSENSGKQSKPSSTHWHTPKNAKELASQANEVATMVLNGEIDLEQARTYATAARTSAQLLSFEVYKSRQIKQEPDLSL